MPSSPKFPFECPSCRHEGRARLDLLGRAARCKACNAGFLMPKHLRIPCKHCEKILRVGPEGLNRNATCKFCLRPFLVRLSAAIKATTTKLIEVPTTVGPVGGVLSTPTRVDFEGGGPSDSTELDVHLASAGGAVAGRLMAQAEPPSLSDLIIGNNAATEEGSGLAPTFEPSTEMPDTVRTLAADRDRLMAEVQALNVALLQSRSFANRAEDLERSLKHATDEIETFRTKGSSEEASLRELEGLRLERDTLKAELKATGKSLKKAKTKAEDATNRTAADLTELREALDRVTAERDALAGELESLRVACAEADSIAVERDRIAVELAGRTEERDGLKAAMGRTEAELRDLRPVVAERDALRAELERLGSIAGEREALGGELQELRAAHEALAERARIEVETERARLEAEIARLDLAFSAGRDAWEAEREGIVAERDAARAEAASAGEEAARLQELHDRLQEGAGAYQTSVAELQAELAREREQSEAGRAEALAALEQHRADREDLRRRQEQARAAWESARLEQDREVARLGNECRRLSDVAAEGQRRLEASLAEMARLREAAAEIEALRIERDAVRTSLVDAQSHCEDLKRSIADAESNVVDRLAEAARAAAADREEVRLAGTEALQVAQALHAERDRLTDELNRTRREADERGRQADQFALRLKRAQATLDALRERLEAVFGALGDDPDETQRDQAPRRQALVEADSPPIEDSIESIDSMIGQWSSESFREFLRRRF